MATMDTNATLAFGFLLGLLPSQVQIADLIVPVYDTDLSQIPIEISLVTKDGKKVHLKITEITLEMELDMEKK